MLDPLKEKRLQLNSTGVQDIIVYLSRCTDYTGSILRSDWQLSRPIAKIAGLGDIPRQLLLFFWICCNGFA